MFKVIGLRDGEVTGGGGGVDTENRRQFRNSLSFKSLDKAEGLRGGGGGLLKGKEQRGVKGSETSVGSRDH